MTLSESDIVYLSDGTKGTVLYIYHHENAAAVEFEEKVLSIPLHALTKEKPDASDN